MVDDTAGKRLDAVEKKTVDLSVRLERLEAEIAPYLKRPGHGLDPRTS